jgi:rhodanese-related sulfurtransferase
MRTVAGSLLLTLPLALLGGCTQPNAPHGTALIDPPAPTSPLICSDETGAFAPDASPGGTPELSVDWVATHHCDRPLVIDVREAEETREGMIPGAASFPLGELEDALARLDPDSPVVFVCRSGRRSARATVLAEELGFTAVASMTGGMLRWADLGLPTERQASAKDGPAPPAHLRSWAVPESPDERVPLEADSIEAALNAEHLPSSKVATLLSRGTESCVDGRDEHAVFGAPGGDAGELIAALATAEGALGRPLRTDEVNELFEAHIVGFGRFYFHSDQHALEALEARLSYDARFVGHRGSTEAFLRQPPPALRPALLEHLLSAESTGCGHLKLMLSHAESYQVRDELVQTVIEAAYRTLWHEPERVDFVVLEGEHHEEAVLSFHSEHPLHAFSSVPALAPHLAGHDFFIHHPEVSAYMQRLHTEFMFEQLPELGRSGVTPVDFQRQLAEHSQAQLEQTLERLAPGLPRFTVRLGANGRLRVAEAKGR